MENVSQIQAAELVQPAESSNMWTEPDGELLEQRRIGAVGPGPIEPVEEDQPGLQPPGGIGPG